MVGPLLARRLRSPSSACRRLLLRALPRLLGYLRGKEAVVMILVFDLRAILPLLFRLFPVVRLSALSTLTFMFATTICIILHLTRSSRKLIP